MGDKQIERRVVKEKLNQISSNRCREARQGNARERERKTERRNDLSHLLRRPIFENECLSSSVCVAFLFLSLWLSVYMYTALFLLLLLLAYARAPCSLDIQTERYSMIEARKNIERTEEKPSDGERRRACDARTGKEKSEDVSST